MKRVHQEGRQRGAVLVFVTIAMLSILAISALAIDGAYMFVTRANLQAAADAAALAGASQLPDPVKVRNEAVSYAEKNMSVAKHGYVLLDADILIGNWNRDTRTFTSGGSPINAVQVTTLRAEANNNKLTLFLAGIVGIADTNVGAQATATNIGGISPRFLCDEDLIDSDVPAIEDLANSLGVSSDEIISDLDGDWFIDLPPGVQLELPTGQVGDEGLFDTLHPSFPFSDSYSHTNFINYNEDSSSWRYDLIDKNDLDPLLGVEALSDPALYGDTLKVGESYLCPVYDSDVNTLNPVGGDPAVNALGLRRGVLAFKVVSIGVDPAGSVLPNITIEVLNPADVDLNKVAGNNPLKIVN